MRELETGQDRAKDLLSHERRVSVWIDDDRRCKIIRFMVKVSAQEHFAIFEIAQESIQMRFIDDSPVIGAVFGTKCVEFLN
jgi:hypothetical protein